VTEEQDAVKSGVDRTVNIVRLSATRERKKKKSKADFCYPGALPAMEAPGPF